MKLLTNQVSKQMFISDILITLTITLILATQRRKLFMLKLKCEQKRKKTASKAFLINFLGFSKSSIKARWLTNREITQNNQANNGRDAQMDSEEKEKKSDNE